MGVLFARERRDAWTTPPIIPPFPGGDVFGRVSFASRPDSAMVIPTVFACVKLLADTVSCMPLETYRKTGSVPTRITDPQLILNPTVDMTQSEWLHMLMVSLLIWGNAFALIASRDQMGRPTQLVLLDPAKVTIKDNMLDGTVRFLIGQTDVTANMWHVNGLTLPGKRIGYSAVVAATGTLGVDVSARKFAKDFYDGGGIPKATVTSDLMINVEQAQTIKQAVQASTMNREPLVLGEGLKYAQNSVKAEESQFLATQQFNIAQIARFFSVPAEMVGGSTGSSMTYSTVELNSLNFLTYGCQFWLKRIEDAFFPILPQPQYVKFDVSQLLRTDTLTDIRVRAIKIAAKLSPPSEQRTEMDLPPLTEAEKAELELVPLTINPSTGEPKALPNPGTPETSDDTPVEGTPPVVPKVGANG